MLSGSLLAGSLLVWGAGTGEGSCTSHACGNHSREETWMHLWVQSGNSFTFSKMFFNIKLRLCSFLSNSNLLPKTYRRWYLGILMCPTSITLTFLPSCHCADISPLIRLDKMKLGFIFTSGVIISFVVSTQLTAALFYVFLKVKLAPNKKWNCSGGFCCWCSWSVRCKARMATSKQLPVEGHLAFIFV